jgi:hypothetical protein
MVLEFNSMPENDEPATSAWTDLINFGKNLRGTVVNEYAKR